MFITADQLLAHAVGDYILQSQWMATNKTKRHLPALVHAFVYSLCFLPLIGWRGYAWIVIFSTHFFIDRFRLARYVVWLKNYLCPRWQLCNSWGFCRETGYTADTPPWLAIWLLIIADNILHVVINGLALRYL